MDYTQFAWNERIYKIDSHCINIHSIVIPLLRSLLRYSEDIAALYCVYFEQQSR